MKSMKNGAGFTLIELVISATMSAIVIFTISSIVIFVTTTLSESAIERDLQMDVNLLANQIIDGVFEPSGFAYGLREAASYTITIPERVDFTDTIGVTRSFITSSSNVIYDSPTQNPAQTVIYTAPAGAGFNVAFFVPSPAVPPRIEMYIAIARTVNGKRLTGSIMTTVYLKNAPQE